MHVMIVDDDPWLAGLLQQLVSNMRPSANIDCFGDIGSALDAWKRKRYQLVLADWNLPDGSGLNLLRSIRQHDHSTPLIMITGRSDRESVMAARPLGINAYITKPFEIPKVRAYLDQLLPPAETDSAVATNEDDFLAYLGKLSGGDLDIPLLSGVKDRLRQASEGTPQDLRKLSEQWQQDPALCAYMISAANSPGYRAGGKPCTNLLDALKCLGERTSLNLAIGLALRQNCCGNDTMLDLLLQEHLNASEQLAERVTQLAKQCRIDPGPLHAAALLHRMGELSVLLQAQYWTTQGMTVDDNLLNQAMDHYARPFAIALKAQWGLPMQLRELIGAIYSLPKTQVRREQVLMRLAAALCNDEPAETIARLKNLAGLD